jgi:hypothetical protein
MKNTNMIYIQLKKNKKVIDKNAHTSYNRSVCASPPYGGSGYEKPQSGADAEFSPRLPCLRFLGGINTLY